MDNHFSQDHCLPRELPCLPWGDDGFPSWKGGWRRRSLLPARVGGAEGAPPRQPPPSHRCVRVLSSLTCQFSGSPLPGGENFQKMNPGDISSPHSLWPCPGSPACWEPRVSAWRMSVCLSPAVTAKETVSGLGAAAY